MANIPLATPTIAIKASSAETVSMTGPYITLSPGGWLPSARMGFLLVSVAVTAVSGTPTLLVVLEISNNNGSSWSEGAMIGVDGERTWGQGFQPTPFSAVSSVNNMPVSLAPLVRYRSIIGGGTPSITYSVTGQFVQNPDGA